MFLDRVKISVKAGNGGDGAISFLRTKLVENGGPDGGEGGKGGDIVFVAKDNLNTLYDFKFKKKFNAENGENGGKKNKTGKSGEDLLIFVPTGTVVIDPISNKIIADLNEVEKRFVALHGGKGGHGNAFYKSSIKQSPHFSQAGEKTTARELILELKTIADVGLVGFPNVGKSSLLSVISNANPKIANYPFTTLYPNLGVVEVLGQTFVVADIPGLIEGASDGAGLGHYFLKHVERVRLILHVVDISESEARDFISDYEIINNELTRYMKYIAYLPQIVVFSKCDLLSENELKEKIARFEKKYKSVEHIEIASFEYKNIELLKKRVLEKLSKLPKTNPIIVDAVDIDVKDTTSLNIEKLSENYFEVSGGLIEELSRGVFVSDPYSFAYFQNRLKDLGIIERLKECGLKQGDVVKIKDIEFEYEE